MSKKSLQEVLKHAMETKKTNRKETATDSSKADVELSNLLMEAAGCLCIEVGKRYQDRTLSHPARLESICLLPANTRVRLADQVICLLNPHVIKIFTHESRYQNKYRESPSYRYVVLDAKSPANRADDLSRQIFFLSNLRGLELCNIPSKGEEGLEKICEILESLDGEFIEDVPANENENEKGEQKE